MNKKLYRLITSKNYFKVINIYHRIFGEKFKKEIPIPSMFNAKIHRLDVINNLIQKCKMSSYLEIGCDKDEVFSFVKIENKIGVDPVSGGTHRMTSDTFFRDNLKFFDLIFIDGLHTYSQVKKDIINSINCLNPKGIILIHDCMPLSFYNQTIPRSQKQWNGDVWKAIVEFRTKKEFYTCVGCFDNGIGMIIKKENFKILNLKKESNFQFKNLSYEEYFTNYESFLNLVNEDDFYKIVNEY